MLEPISKKSFKKDVKTLINRKKNMEKLKEVINLLLNESILEPSYDNHPLHGEYAGDMECHIEPDWLLIYRIETGFLYLIRTGTHSDLF
jgi:mRNA interferase YafQ